jgi:hypothetical protein
MKKLNPGKKRSRRLKRQKNIEGEQDRRGIFMSMNLPANVVRGINRERRKAS